MKTKQKILLHFFLGIFLFALGITLVHAQGGEELGLTKPSSVPSQFGTVPQIVSLIFNIAIYGSGVAFIILFLVGGIQYLGAAGNEDALNKAKKLLINSVIGLIIVLASWAVGNFIIRALYRGAPSINIPSGPAGGTTTPAKGPEGQSTGGSGTGSGTSESVPTELPTVPEKGKETGTISPTVSVMGDAVFQLGQTATISWESSNAKSCDATKSSTSVEGWASGPVSLSGSRTVKPLQKGTYTFTITCTAEGGKTASGNAIVTVY